MDSADIRFATDEGRPILVISGELDAACTEALAEACRSLVSQTSRPVLDVAGVTFIDSSALHVLLETRFTDGVESVVLRNQPAVVRRLLEITNLADDFVDDASADTH
jgi:anti-anti-sigma factor